MTNDATELRAQSLKRCLDLFGAVGTDRYLAEEISYDRGSLHIPDVLFVQVWEVDETMYEVRFDLVHDRAMTITEVQL